MQIDATGDIILNTPDSNPAAANKPDTAKPPATTDSAESVLRAEYSQLIQQSLQCAETDLQAVEEAKNALANGELDTPQAIQSAAANILKSGI